MGEGGGWKFLVTEKQNSPKKCSWGLKCFFSLLICFKNVPGVLKRTHTFFFWGGGWILGCPTPPPGGRAGSENDTLLPMTMTCDRLKFWNGPASVKNYHPETLAAEE